MSNYNNNHGNALSNMSIPRKRDSRGSEIHHNNAQNATTNSNEVFMTPFPPPQPFMTPFPPPQPFTNTFPPPQPSTLGTSRTHGGTRHNDDDYYGPRTSPSVQQLATDGRVHGRIQQQQHGDNADKNPVAEEVEDEVAVVEDDVVVVEDDAVVEITYRDRVLEQLPEKERNFLPIEAFPPTGWEERKQKAAQVVVKDYLSNILSSAQTSSVFVEEPDSDQDSYFDDNGQENSMNLKERAHYVKFIEALPNCLPLTMGFHLVCSLRQDWCFCPCHHSMRPWREMMGVDDWKYHCSKKNGKFEAHGLVRHVEDMQSDIHHKLILQYLNELYFDYYNGGSEPFLHKAFYDVRSEKYIQVDHLEQLENNRAMQEMADLVARERALREELERKNTKLSKELEDLKLVSPDKAEKLEQENKLREKFHLPESQEERVSDATLQSVRAAYKDYWVSAHTSLGMKFASAAKNIKFKVPPKIRLQNIFDNWYTSPETSCIFMDIISDGEQKEDFEKGRTCAQRLLKLSSVELGAVDVMGGNRQLKKATTAIDAGGVTREFFSQIWRQMGGLKVKHAGKVIRLFGDVSEAGCIPVQDDTLAHGLRELDKSQAALAMKKIKAFYRAIGRLMIHWLATDPDVSFETFEQVGGMQCGHSIADNAMPAFYRNVLLRGLSPKDPNYPLGELVDHMLQLVNFQARNKDSNEKERALKEKLDVSNTEADVRKLAQEFWVDDRSIALKALKEGLTLHGFVDLSPVLKLSPIGAINLVVFSKAVVLVEDVLDAIKNGDPPAVSDDMVAYLDAQLNLITELKNILTERGSDEYKKKHPKKANFLGQFINFCTGLWTIPDSCHGNFKITIEFQSELKADNLPVAHTCVNVIGFPAQAYNGNRKTLEEKLDLSIALSKGAGAFSMQ